jgi:hypothetical protein
MYENLFTKSQKINGFLLLSLFWIINFGLAGTIHAQNFTGGSSTIYVDSSVKDFPQITNSADNVLQFVSHGRPGELLIDGAWKNAQEIAAFIKPLIDQKNGKISHVNIYACNFARGAIGEEAVAILETDLGVSIAASNDITGRDGNWTLEVGQPLAAFAVSGYEGNLQTCVCDTTANCWGVSTHCTSWYSTTGNLDIYGSNNPTSFTGLPTPKWGFDVHGQSISYGTPQAGCIEPDGSGALVVHDYATIVGNQYSEKFWLTQPPAVTGPYDNNGPVVLQVVDVATGTVLQSIDLNPGGIFTGGWYTLNFTAIGPISQIQVGYTDPNPDLNVVTTNFMVFPYPLKNLTTGATTSEFTFVSPSAPTNVTASYTNVYSGGSTVLSAESCGPNGFITWYSNSGLTTVVGYGNNLQVSPTATTTYYATCTIECNCTSTAGTPVTVTYNNTPCPAGSTAPVITVASVTNSCPSNTVNLTTLTNTGSIPAGSTLVWSLHNPPNSPSDTLTTAQASAYGTSGAVYAFYRSTTGGCYSPVDGVLVAINDCLDTDGDGVIDVTDLDDDNDGILDIVESPSCFYTQAELLATMTLSGTDMSWSGTYPFTAAFDASTATFSQTDPLVQNWANKSIIEFSLGAAVPVTSLTLNASYFSANTSSTFRLQGWNGAVWVNLTNPIADAGTAVHNIVLTNTLQPSGTFSKVRVFGVAGTDQYGRIYNSTLQMGTINSAYYPKPNCVGSDADGDNIPNHLDPDSDGDGCTDAYEAGTSTTNVATVGTSYGPNGFADNLETAGNGIYTGTYTYSNATNASIHTCPESCTYGISSKSQYAISANTATVQTDANYFGASGAPDILDAASNIAENRLRFGTPSNFAAQMRFGTPIVPGDTITVWLSALTSTALNFTVALLSSSNTLFNVSTNSLAVTSGTTTAPYVPVTVVVPAGATGLYNEVWIWGNSGSFYLDAVKVSNSICASCPAGGVAPNLSSYTICPPATSLDISAITASNLPAGCTLSWHTAVPTTDANMITAPGSVTSGVYYASFRYSSSCYSGYNGDGTAATRIIVGTDGNCDGTPDFLDMDDDNDGIPDVIENNCTSPTSAPIVSGTGSGTSSGYQGSGNPIEDVTSYYPFNLPGAVFNTTGGTDASGITYTYNFPSPKTNIYFGFRNVDYYRRVFTDQDGNPIPLVLIGASSSQTQVDGNVLFDSNDCTVNSGTSADGVVMLLGTYTQVRMQLVLNTIGLSASCTSTDGWSGYFLELGCNASLDTDGDGIANSSDLDSDGDGCPDAVEAKVALQGGTVSSGVVAGPYNSLGYATSLESSYEDDNTVFTSEYKLFALSASLNLCTDTDSDGIVNVYDLDDDNDGILDAIESPSCFMTAAEQPMTGDRTLVPGVIATSDMDMTAGFPIEYAINGTNTDALNAKPTSYGPEEGSPITIEYPYPVNLSSMTVNWGTAATAGFRSNSGNFILQASNDGETWTTVGPTAGTNIVFNTPSPITFNVTQNAGLYKFYRIYHPTYLQSWTGTFEVTTALNTTGYNASMYPKGTTCTNGTDSDNIPNHLDTDSDGDGCPDAVEGGGSFTDGDLTNADNLCNTTSCVDINGIPTVATSSGQTIGDSQNASVQSADCVDNTDTDGDGTPDTTDSAPNDPCVDYTIGSEVITGSLWASADCDGDGVTNGAESTATVGPTSNPYNPCEFNVTEISLVATSTGDCDGDGVTNADEINGTDGNPLTTTDNTDANDPCDYNAVDQGTPSATWLAADCDGDGNPNGTDNNPLTPTALNDSGTAPFGTTTSINILNNDDFLANDGNTITRTGGTAGGTIVFDPITGELDYTPLATEVGTTVTVVYEVCQGTVCDQATVTITIPASGDSDGDGVTDAQESIDGTDPNNPCSLVLASVSQIATSIGDCDGDGVTNAAEINGPDGAVGGGDGTNPTNPCSLNVSQVTLTATSTGDCDGDGVTNADEINGTDGNPLTTTDNTDANDPCDYNAVDQGTLPAYFSYPSG